MLGAATGLYSWLAGKQTDSPWELAASVGFPVVSVVTLLLGVDRILETVASRNEATFERGQAMAYREVRSLTLLIGVAALPGFSLVVLLTVFDGSGYTLLVGIGLLFFIIILAIAVVTGSNVARRRLPTEDVDAIFAAVEREVGMAAKRLEADQRTQKILDLENDWVRMRRKPTQKKLTSIESKINDLRK